MFQLKIYFVEITHVVGIFYFLQHGLAHCVYYFVAIGTKIYATVPNNKSVMVSIYADVVVLQSFD